MDFCWTTSGTTFSVFSDHLQPAKKHFARNIKKRTYPLSMLKDNLWLINYVYQLNWQHCQG